MDNQRRQLVRAIAIGTAGLASNSALAAVFRQGTTPPLSILILGGTGFIGPHMVKEALRRGHQVTLFNRMQTNNKRFPDLTTLKGDRDNGLDALKGHKWDVVIDNSGYVPRHVADSARLLAPAASHYIYISTISAYASLASPSDEDAPLATISDETIEKVTNETYGPLKALCEQRAAAEFGADRLTILRPTYVCGPGDHTDRYTYWPVRAARGGSMLWPGTPADKIQIIDVRDLANFTIDAAERRFTGPYNTVTPAGKFTMGDLLEDCSAVIAGEVEPVWVDHEFLAARDIGEGNTMPIWSPPLPEYAGLALVSGERAVARGLRNRPTRETARDTLAWWQCLSPERSANLKTGLQPDREAELLADWRKASQANAVRPGPIESTA